MVYERVPVLIVGGGIVGLCASLFLSQQGIHSLLIERRVGTSIHPRSRGVNARTMELFRGLDIDEAVRAAGAELAPSFGIFTGGTLAEVIEAQPRQTTREVPDFFSKFAAISPALASRGTQDLVEPVLLRAARERGGDLRFHTELLSFEQDEMGVTATVVEQASGTQYKIGAEYMIAADGAGSPIRKMLNAPTSGRGTLGHLLNILFQADLRDLVRGREFSICRIECSEVVGLFTSINNSDRWVFHLSYDPAKGERPEDFPPERCKDLLRIALGMPQIEIEIKSILPWESAMRVVDTFQHDRIFLAGDAAHQMPPWGGQGANTGVADAHNLAWKLALVLKGQATSALLQTYDAERHPVGYIAAEESAMAGDERGLLSFKNFGASIADRFGRIMGFGYEYSSQAIVVENNPVSRTDPLGLDGSPGTRAPHLWVTYQGKRISTLDLFNTTFVLLTGPAGSAWREAARTLAERMPMKLVTYCIGADCDLHDLEHDWQAKSGIQTDGALLVRPDGFVAWRVQSSVDHPQQVLSQVLNHLISR